MSTSTRDRIVAYLGQGIAPSIVATSCGVTPAYVSQLLELPDVREEVAGLRVKKLEEALEVDSTIEKIEKAALRQVELKLPFVKTAGEAAKIFATLNSAKKKAAGTDQNSDAMAAQQVTITVPRAAAISFRLNETNQVIEVEGRTMAPLPSKALPAMIGNRATAIPLDDVEPKKSVINSILRPAAPPSPSELAFREKQQAADTARAAGILRDLSFHLDGVEVVL